MQQVKNHQESAVLLTNVQFEHRHDALGIGTARPRLSWMCQTDLAGWRQEAYEIEAYSAPGDVMEQTGRVVSDQSVLVPWPFAPLTSRERRLVRVRVWDHEDRCSPWSPLSPVEAGLLEPDDWSARFITPADLATGEDATPLPMGTLCISCARWCCAGEALHHCPGLL